MLLHGVEEGGGGEEGEDGGEEERQTVVRDVLHQGLLGHLPSIYTMPSSPCVSELRLRIQKS